MTVDKTKGWSFTYYVQGRKENKNDIAVFFFSIIHKYYIGKNEKMFEFPFLKSLFVLYNIT